MKFFNFLGSCSNSRIKIPFLPNTVIKHGRRSLGELFHFLLLSIVIGFWGVSTLYYLDIGAGSAQAQVQPPDRKFLFLEDREVEKREKEKREELKRKRKARQVTTPSSASGLPFDIDAANIDFDTAKNVVNATGGIVVSHRSAIIEAEEGSYDIGQNQLSLRDDIKVSEVTGTISADEAVFNLDTGAGKLQGAEFYFEQGEYNITAAEASRSGEDLYKFEDATLTTCNCPDSSDCAPWRFRADEVQITRNGYGQLWGGVLDVQDVPILYIPYFVFPAKTERQSGLLPMLFGNGSRNGFELQVPFFWAIDNSSDATITPLIETKTRAGVVLEYREIFSRNAKLEFGGTYLNESKRDGKLLGTNVDDLFDPTLDENRFAGYLDYKWSNDVGGKQVQVILDGRYVSDDLLIREFENEQIAKESARYVTSRAVARTTFLDSYSLDLLGEFNQSIVDDDDFIFQRLPQLTLSGLNVFRPFGENTLGAKLVLSSEATATNFARKESFDGLRSEVRERVKMPFHFRNYFDGELEIEGRATQYHLDQQDDVDKNISDDGTEELEVVNSFEKDTDRFIPGFEAKLGTVVEKVFTASEGNLIKKVAELGSIGRKEQLVRLKHTIEPGIKYRFVPQVDQVENPQFDSKDRLARRNVVTYELMQRLYARYEPRNEYLYGIEEATPEVDDLGSLRDQTALDEKLTFGVERGASGEYRDARVGQKKELARFKLSQSLDVDEQRKNDSSRPAYTDLEAELLLLPNDYVRLKTSTDFDIDQSQFSSYSVESQMIDKRGDELRLRLNFVDNNVRQLESSLQLLVTNNLRLGYYSRYDDLSSEFIEQKVGLRILSSCRCWTFDFELSDKVNPDETQVAFNVTLAGVGEFGNSFFSFDDDDQNS